MDWYFADIANAGFVLNIDSNGAVLNEEDFDRQYQTWINNVEQTYADSMNALSANYDAQINALDGDNSPEKDAIKEAYENNKKALEDQKEDQEEYYQSLKDKLADYKDASDRYYDAVEQQEENLYTIRGNNLDKIKTKMEEVI